MAHKIETTEEKRARETIEQIAKDIENVATSVRAALGGRLTRNAITILLVHSTRLSHGNVDAILNAITELDKKFLK